MPHAPRPTRTSVLLPYATLGIVLNFFHLQLSQHGRRFETTIACRAKYKLEVNCWLTVLACIDLSKMEAGCRTRLGCIAGNCGASARLIQPVGAASGRRDQGRRRAHALSSPLYPPPVLHSTSLGAALNFRHARGSPSGSACRTRRATSIIEVRSILPSFGGIRAPATARPSAGTTSIGMGTCRKDPAAKPCRSSCCRHRAAFAKRPSLQ